MQYIVFDIEADNLLDKITHIHCLSYTLIDDNKVATKKETLTTYPSIIKLLKKAEEEGITMVGHNIIRYDIPALEKILHIKTNLKLIDTLALSWYLYPNRVKHGLEFWGDDLGVKKPYIADWKNQSIKDYVHRCEADVEINLLLFYKEMNYLSILYNNDSNDINNIIDYLSFKLDCAREQEEVRCKVDRQLINKSLLELNTLKEEKVLTLISSMPKDITYKEISKPSKMYKINGELTVAGIKWLNILNSLNLPEDYEQNIIIKVSEQDGNPASTDQLKDWLFSLGWEPRNFEYRKNKAGEINKIPQIYVEEDGSKEVCESIKSLYSIEPALESLDMLSLINHRIGIFESFLDNMDEEDYVRAEIGGFTNTLRMRHKKPITNLPKVFKFYGEQIRGSIISPGEEYLLCGSDMSSLEDTTKQHYMYFFDPDYVTQMRVPGFDPHLDIGVLSKLMTLEESDEFKRIKKKHKTEELTTEEINLFDRLNQVRNKAKTVNFAGVYGAGPPKIALTTGMPLEQAKQLHKTYWERNKSVKQIANSCITKVLNIDDERQMWLWNPVSKFWYSLRVEKDKFSVLNQGTGVFCFDSWLRQVRQRGIKIMLQYHDEIAFSLLKEDKEISEQILKESIQKVNENIKLNVPLGVSVDFGINYAQIH